MCENVFKIENFKQGKNYAIEASAGTGKTYSIKKIVRKLVGDLDPIPLEKILIVTYTEKATGELRNRIREELTEAYPEKVFDLDNAPIFTIHSFCNSIIKEFASVIKRPTSLTNVDENELNDFADEYIRDSKIKDELKKYSPDFAKKVRDCLVDSVNKYYLNNNYDEDIDIVSLFKFEGVNEYYSSKDEFEKLFPEINTYLASVNDAITDFEANPPISSKTHDVTKENKDRYNNTKNDYEKAKAIRDSISINSRFDFECGYSRYINDDVKETFEKIEQLASFYQQNQIIAAKYLKDFYKSWQEYKEKNKFQNFNDMIRAVREAVLDKESVLKDKIREKYTYAIIDEFQDTNQQQWDIFKTVFMNDGNNIIVVGDPKQSIYSFQGADVFVYKNACDEIKKAGGIVEVLDTNYRATSNMIIACNDLFKTDDFFVDDSIEFIDSNSPEYIDEAGNKVADQKKFSFDQENKPIWIGLNVDDKEYAKLAVKKMIECLELDENGKTKLRINERFEKEENGKTITYYVERNVTFKDFAILARARSGQSAITYYLKKYGVPFIKYKDSGLFKTLEASHWLALFEAIDDDDLTGKGIGKFKKALFTHFFNKSLYEINNDLYNKDTCEEMILIKKWKELAKDAKWEDLIDNIIIDSGMIEHMANSTKQDSFSKFKQLGNYLIDYLTSNHTLRDACDLLYSKLNSVNTEDEDDDDDDTDIIGTETDFDAVRIMTIHASKGLEYPVVISIAGFKNPSDKSKSILFKEEDNTVLTYNCKKGDEYDKYNCARIQEEMRLLYVDFTRAKYVLMLPISKPGKVKKKTAIEKLRSIMGKFYNEHSEHVMKLEEDEDIDYKAIVTQTLKANDKSSEDDSDEDDRLESVKKGIKEGKSFRHSYISLSHPKHENIIVGDKENYDKEGEVEQTLESFDTKSLDINLDYKEQDAPILSPDFPKGTAIGSTLHEVFEKYDFSKPIDEELNDLIEARFKANGFECKDSWVDDVKRIVENTLNATFIDTKNGKTFKLSEITEKDKLAEVEYNYNLFDERLKNYLNGFIDLVFRRDDRFYIIDWKSDSISEKFTSYCKYDALKKHVDECYSIQRVLYSYILIKWLKTVYKKDETETDIFNNYFGGIYYVFIKGTESGTSNGIYAHNWETFKDLEESYNNILNSKIPNGGKK